LNYNKKEYLKMNKISKIVLITTIVFSIALLVPPLSSVLAQDEPPSQSEQDEERGLGWLKRPFIKRNINMREVLVKSPPRP
jgi:hypothetical protein